MRKLGYILLVMPLLALLGLASCQSDKDIDTTRGRQPGTNDVAYFGNNAVTDTILIASENKCEITVPVLRTNNISQAVDIPVESSVAPENMKMASTVHFNAGESVSTLTLDCSDVKKYENQTVVLKISDDYSNPYSNSMTGTDVLRISFIVSSWDKIVSQASDSIVGTKKGTYLCKSDFYKLRGLNRFKVSNFLNQGYDMEFTLVGNSSFKSADRTTWSGHFKPLTCYWDYSSYGSDYDSYCIFQKPGANYGYIYINLEDSDAGVSLSEASNDYVLCNKGDYSYTGTQSFANKTGDEYTLTLKTMFGASYKAYDCKYVWKEDQCVAVEE